MNTLPDVEKFRLHVDSLEAAAHFHDLPACHKALQEKMGEEYARRAVLALAVRLMVKRAAA